MQESQILQRRMHLQIRGDEVVAMPGSEGVVHAGVASSAGVGSFSVQPTAASGSAEGANWTSAPPANYMSTGFPQLYPQHPSVVQTPSLTNYGASGGASGGYPTSTVAPLSYQNQPLNNFSSQQPGPFFSGQQHDTITREQQQEQQLKESLIREQESQKQIQKLQQQLLQQQQHQVPAMQHQHQQQLLQLNAGITPARLFTIFDFIL